MLRIWVDSLGPDLDPIEELIDSLNTIEKNTLAGKIILIYIYYTHISIDTEVLENYHIVLCRFKKKTNPLLYHKNLIQNSVHNLMIVRNKSGNEPNPVKRPCINEQFDPKTFLSRYVLIFRQDILTPRPGDFSIHKSKCRL